MSDPNEYQDNKRRGFEDAGRGNSAEPVDWEAREAYRAGRQQHANAEAWKGYADSVFGGTLQSGSSGQFNLLGCLGALWFLAYYGIGALIVGSVAQVLTKTVLGSGLFEMLAAVVGFIGGFIIIGWAFARVELFRKCYALALGIGFPVLVLAALLFGSFQSTPILQRLMAAGIVALIFGGSSWLTYRYIEKRAGVA